jgi:hypothetical protein
VKWLSLGYSQGDWNIEILGRWWCRKWLISVNLGYPNSLLELTARSHIATVIVIIARVKFS